MPPGPRDPSDPAEWLRRARSNLVRAKARDKLPDVLLEDLCFDAQQAAEKAIKALLVGRAIQFPKSHDIIDLLTLFERGGGEVPPEIREADRLTSYAVEARYPGLSEDVSAEEYLRAIEFAERVVRWVERLIGPRTSGENE
jgi:HEPN domain-containing protein